jgi:PAS domain S-box-containing protein
MRIRTQFIVSMVIFSVVLLIVAASVIVTNQQISQLDQKQEISANVEKGADELNILSSQYFLYQQTQLLTFWQSNITSISGNLSNLSPFSSAQQTLVNNARGDLSQLNASFTNLVSFLETAPRNVSVRVVPEFQNDWNLMVTEHQTFGLDASRLSESLRTQADQLRQTNIVLVIALLGIFGAFLLTIYLITYRRTLKSISNLQEGIKIIGSGNLDYSIQTKKEDEISELSQAFNKMTANLKTVTASKTDLEQEIAGRKQAEIALRESEQRWATTLASIGDAVIASDLSGRVMFMNGVAEELTGWTFSEASLKPVKEVFNIVNEQTRVEVEDPVSKVLEKGLIVGLANHTVLIRKDGTEVAIDDSGAPIKDKDGKTTGVVLVFRDITERKMMEAKLEEYSKHLENLVEERTKQLKDSERLAAIGAIAGMVGHDIRNPLQAMISDVYLTKTDLASTPESDEKKSALDSLQEIEKNIDYINKIVADLQDFARPLNPQAEETDLKLIIDELLAKNGLPENVKVSLKVEAEARKVVADSSYINRIMYNLVNNAVQAMPNGGKLTIRAYKEANDFVITVKDTGVGIPEGVKSKLFTPMFTTKAKGQGFGLAVIKRMTEALGGTVTFESQEGKGTTFIVRFPPPQK